MTHTRKLADSEGAFEPWTLVDIAEAPYLCRRCKSGLGLRFRIWESSDGAYEDVHYMCLPCGHTWWIDGIDS